MNDLLPHLSTTFPHIIPTLLFILIFLLPLYHIYCHLIVDPASASNHIAQLRARQAALMLQRDSLQQHIDKLDESIELIAQAVQSSRKENSTKPSLPSRIRSPTRQATSRLRLYNPPRTPEERRKNNIVQWVWDMQRKKCN